MTDASTVRTRQQAPTLRPTDLIGPMIPEKVLTSRTPSYCDLHPGTELCDNRPVPPFPNKGAPTMAALVTKGSAAVLPRARTAELAPRRFYGPAGAVDQDPERDYRECVDRGGTECERLRGEGEGGTNGQRTLTTLTRTGTEVFNRAMDLINADRERDVRLEIARIQSQRQSASSDSERNALAEQIQAMQAALAQAGRSVTPGLSAGAKIGIGVGVGAAVLGLGYVLLGRGRTARANPARANPRRRRRRR